jgi:hypothetical protein
MGHGFGSFVAVVIAAAVIYLAWAKWKNLPPFK